MANIWTASKATCKIDAASSVTITTSAALDTFFSSGTAFEGYLKDLKVKLPVGDYTNINLHGTDAGGYQNQAGEDKPPGLVEITGTLVWDHDEVLEPEIFGSGDAVNGTHTRYSVGKAAVTKVAVLLNLEDGADEANLAGTNMRLTMGDINSTGADGHFEMPVTFKCLAADFHGPEFKD